MVKERQDEGGDRGAGGWNGGNGAGMEGRGVAFWGGGLVGTGERERGGGRWEGCIRSDVGGVSRESYGLCYG